jgi:hypothetical protein
MEIARSIAWIDNHAQTQGGLDSGVEMPELDSLLPLISKAFFERIIPDFQPAIGGEEKPVGVLIVQPGYKHAPELESFRTFQGQTGRPVKEQHQHEQQQYNQREHEQQPSFQASHRRLSLLLI